MLAFFVSHTVEQAAVERRIELLDRRQLAGYPLSLGSYGGRPVLVCRTGLGDPRGEEAAEALQSEYALAAVVSARIASALPDDLSVGDLVLCERVYMSRGATIAEPPAEADRRLVTLAQMAARDIGVPYRLGDALAFTAPAGEPFAPEELPSAYPLAVVTTEDHGLGEVAARRGIPFLAVRVALGHSCDGVPNGIDLMEEAGVVSRRKLVGRLVRLVDVPAIWALAGSVRAASQRLSEFVEAFMHEWSLEPRGARNDGDGRTAT